MKVLVSDKMAKEAIAVLEDAGHDVTCDEVDAKSLVEVVGNYDALMVRSRTKATAEVVRAGAKGSLKVIGRAGIGVDNIDIAVAGELGIPVVNSPTGATASVAELAIGHMLVLARHIMKADHAMKRGEWIKKQCKGNELGGKVLGLIGCGNIGRKTAEYARLFGMSVIGFDPFLDCEMLGGCSIEKVEDLSELMSRSDFISMHIPHTDGTHHIVDEQMLKSMKSSAFLVNCARGGTVDEAALFKALSEGWIAGAALDVFESEPLGESPLLGLDNIVLTPHIGANTKEGQIRAGTVCADQMNLVLAGKDPEFCVNKKFLK